MDTWGMPDCQSGAALPWAAAPVSVSLRIATNRSCQVDCHEESCGNAPYGVACSSGRAPVSFQKKETGAGWLNEMAKRIGCCSAARKVHRLPQWADKSSRHPSPLESDRASRRTLIALRKNHHANGVALKVLATWAGAVNDSGPCANFYTHSKRRSSVTTKACEKWRLSPVLSPRSRPRSA